MRLLSLLILLLFSRLYAMSDVDKLISEASARNSYFLYGDAVKLLGEAIERNPHEKEAYKERAFSYFELNRIDLALEDYRRAIDPNPSHGQHLRNYSMPTHPSLDFAKGLLYLCHITQMFYLIFLRKSIVGINLLN